MFVIRPFLFSRLSRVLKHISSPLSFVFPRLGRGLGERDPDRSEQIGCVILFYFILYYFFGSFLGNIGRKGIFLIGNFPVRWKCMYGQSHGQTWMVLKDGSGSGDRKGTKL